jgi:hypothetical protein
LKRKTQEQIIKGGECVTDIDITIPFSNQYSELPNATKPKGFRRLRFPAV